jgi:putative flippase GtrA
MNPPCSLSVLKEMYVSLAAPLKRWLRFNLVGVFGMGVQLTALAVLSRCLPHHVLLATAVAIELTLLHNFTWHVRYTWRDRGDGGSVMQRLTRFQLSNGLVSIAGNLAVMHVLVSKTHLPVVAANVVAILSCSVANFWLGDRWAFRRSALERGKRDATFAK